MLEFRGLVAAEPKHEYIQDIEEKAAELKPRESGLLAIDWWNGNRSVPVDVDLTGMLVEHIGQTQVCQCMME